MKNSPTKKIEVFSAVAAAILALITIVMWVLAVVTRVEGLFYGALLALVVSYPVGLLALVNRLLRHKRDVEKS